MLGICYWECSVFIGQCPPRQISRRADSVGSGAKPAMAMGPFPCSPVHLLYPLAQRDPPTPTGHFRTFSTRNRGCCARDGTAALAERRKETGTADAGSGWYFSCCRRYEFCFFWYEFCSFLYEFVFFLHVLCCMFGNDPRYSAKKRVFGGRKTAILPGISPKTFEDKEMRTKNKFAEIRDVWTLPGGWACEQGRGRRDSSWGGRRKSDNKT